MCTFKAQCTPEILDLITGGRKIRYFTQCRCCCRSPCQTRTFFYFISTYFAFLISSRIFFCFMPIHTAHQCSNHFGESLHKSNKRSGWCCFPFTETRAIFLWPRRTFPFAWERRWRVRRNMKDGRETIKRQNKPQINFRHREIAIYDDKKP